jgi:hypothetical protein
MIARLSPFINAMSSLRNSPRCCSTSRRSVFAGSVVAFVAMALSSSIASAEGTDLVGVSQALRAGTSLGVDILNSSSESFVWRGKGSVEVYGPSGTHLRTAVSGATVSPTEGAGSYRVVVNQDQTIGSLWDLSVTGQTDAKGRVFSKNWQFNAGAYASTAATNASFYALVPSGSAANLAVIELKLDGLAGYIYDINANRRGVNGDNAGRSVLEAGNSTTPEYSIYLRVPALANFATSTPGISGLAYIGGVDHDVSGQPMTPCNEILPGNSRGYFSFTSATDGTYHLQCDLDGDGIFNIDTGKDLLLIGQAATGANVVPWDGVNNGSPVHAGTYQCRVQLTVGEFHYVGRDIETSYRGMRIFRVNQDDSRVGLPMYWNDSLVQSKDILMPSRAKGLVGSEGNILPGSYTATPVPNVNARSWGDFSGGGKGNESYLDTYVWLDQVSSSQIQIQAADATDTDGDGLTNYQESCLVGSSPTNADTDGNGVADGAQYAIPTSTAFSGLESNGRLASALARRAIRRSRMSVAPARPGLTTLTSGPSSEASGWLPATFSDVTAVSDTPEDLLAITNASAVTGVDYVSSSGQRRGGALIVESTGAFYEHQKAICDRVHGASLLDVRPVTIRGLQAFETTVSSPSEGRLEYAVSVHLWSDAASVDWTPAAFWVKEDAPNVSADVSIVTIQAWGDAPEFARDLLDAILTNVEAARPIDWPVTNVVESDEQWAIAPPAALAPTLPTPSMVVQTASVMGGQVALTTRRLSGGGNATLQFTTLEEDAVTETHTSFPVDPQSALTRMPLALPPFLEATVDVMDGDRVVDRVWVSDGAWAPFDDSVWQGAPADGTFSRSECQSKSVLDSDQAVAWGVTSDTQMVRLSGCGKVLLSNPTGSSGLARQLLRPFDARPFSTAAYFIRSDKAYEVCAEGPKGRGCAEMPARSSGAWEAIPVGAFGAAAEGIELLSFASQDGSTSMEIAGLTFLSSAQKLDTRPASADSSGCSFAPASSRNDTGLWSSLVTLGLLVMGLRRRRAS